VPHPDAAGKLQSGGERRDFSDKADCRHLKREGGAARKGEEKAGLPDRLDERGDQEADGAEAHHRGAVPLAGAGDHSGEELAERGVR